MVGDSLGAAALSFTLTSEAPGVVVKTLFYVLLLTPSLLLFDLPRANEVVQSDGAQNGSAATQLKPSFSTSKQTQYVSCWDKKNKLTGSHLVRTPVLVSSDGSHRAYVEVESTAFQPKDLATYSGPLCENTSRLFLLAVRKQNSVKSFLSRRRIFQTAIAWHLSIGHLMECIF